MRAAASLTLAVSCLLAAPTVSPLTATAGAKPKVDAEERAIVRAINRQRAKHGIAKVRSSARLARAADYHSWEMLGADYFAHESRDGGPFDQRVRRFARHRALGETLAMLGGCGKRSARRVVRMWMDSPRPPRDPALVDVPARRTRQAHRRARRQPRVRGHRRFRVAQVAPSRGRGLLMSRRAGGSGRCATRREARGGLAALAPATARLNIRRR
jgi:hypothetical protein